MADPQKSGLTAERDIEKAITALKKGSYLLKYGHRGKPKFCPFIWFLSKAIFWRYPRPEKEYQSFSLICHDRTLDLVNVHKRGNDVVKGNISPGSPHGHMQKRSPSVIPFELLDIHILPTQTESPSQNRLGKAFSDIVSYTAATKGNGQAEPVANSLEVVSSRNSSAQTFRISISSALSSSSQGSSREDFDSLGDEGISDIILSCGQQRQGSPSQSTKDTLLPKLLESTVVLDVHQIACGYNHALLVDRQGEIFSWGKDLGGGLGHGTKCDVSHPKLIHSLGGISIEQIASGEYHSCAITLSGDLYTWGDGVHSSGMLGHGSQAMEILICRAFPVKWKLCMDNELLGLPVGYDTLLLWSNQKVKLLSSFRAGLHGGIYTPGETEIKAD